jgi:amino acid permease
MKLKSNYFEAVAILVGTMIGAGIFSLPYAVQQIGWWPGLAIMTLVALMVLLLYLLLGELSLSTRGLHHFTGFAQVYLGPAGKWLMLFTMVITLYLPLLAYTVATGDILVNIIGGEAGAWGWLYLAVCSLAIFFGLKLFRKVEFVVNLGFIFLIVLISYLAAPYFSLDNIGQTDWSRVIFPYGAILFAFGGGSAVPLMRAVLKDQEDKLRSAIITGLSIVFVLYLLFAFVLAGALGNNVAPIVTLSLGSALGPTALLVANVFAIFAMTSCFLSIGSSLQLMFQKDFNLRKTIAWVLTVIVPALLFFIGIDNYFALINLSGAVVGGLESILLLIIYWRLRHLYKTGRTPEYKLQQYLPIIIILFLMFLTGLIYSLLNNF